MKKAQALSTILLVIFLSCGRLIVTVSFICIYLECFFIIIDGVGSFCYGGWLVIEYL